jgi:hypothetical protein
VTHMVKLVALLKRKPGISKEEFARRWLVDHFILAGEGRKILFPYAPRKVGKPIDLWKGI